MSKTMSMIKLAPRKRGTKNFTLRHMLTLQLHIAALHILERRMPRIRKAGELPTGEETRTPQPAATMVAAEPQPSIEATAAAWRDRALAEVKRRKAEEARMVGLRVEGGHYRW